MLSYSLTFLTVLQLLTLRSRSYKAWSVAKNENDGEGDVFWPHL
jgi:hypothetical protein